MDVIITEGANPRESSLPYLDNLPDTATGQYGLTKEKNITFQNKEQHRLFLLGKFIESVPQIETEPNGWDSLYQDAKEKGKIIAVRGSFNKIDLNSEVKFGNNRSMSIIAPANDAVTRPNGYIYEVSPESIQILFPQDSQTSTKHFINSIEKKLKDGTSIYTANGYTIKLSELSHLVLPKDRRRASEAIIKFSKDTKLVGVFSKDDLPTWAMEANNLHVKYIGTSPNLNHSATQEIKTYIARLSKIIGKSEGETRQLATDTCQEITQDTDIIF